MSHDNARFNVSGDSPKALAATLHLWSLIHGPAQYDRPGCHLHPIDFAGYCLHPQYGMVLFTYGDNAKMTPFPFEEGKDPQKLATFFYNYLSSSKSKVNDDLTEVKKSFYMGDEEAKAVESDFSWDRDADHDGSNERHWRVMTFRWGHVLGNEAPLTIRPAYAWYGK
jgi:hypothetical protein